MYSYLSSDGNWRKVDWFYTTACFIWLTPLQFGLLPVRNDSINLFLGGCMIFAVWIAIFVETGGRKFWV